MPAAAQHRAPRRNRLVRKLAVAGTGVAVLALPLIGATSASAATPTVQTATTLGYQLTLDWADDLNTAGNNYQAVRTFTATTP